ncbi:hypothetical protein RhiirB3_443370 [Rhizophagus irregularis]|nr:hypothetical protein RhiirB3_443370 [Rhizophagus irregularis]
MNDTNRYLIYSNQDLCEIFVSKNNLKFTVLIEMPSKSFNFWTFLKVCELYDLSVIYKNENLHAKRGNKKGKVNRGLG